MATPPTFVQEAETVFNTATSPKTSAAITDSVADVLASCGIGEDGGISSLTPTLTGETFTSRQNLGTLGGSTRVHLLTAVIASAGVAETVSLARAGTTTLWWGANELLFTGSDGVGGTNGAQVVTPTTGAPNLSVTTTQDNSAIVLVLGDWSSTDPTLWTWRTVNGLSPTVQSTFRDTAHYSMAIAWYPDAGAAGAKSVGVTNTLAYTIGAVEVKGAAAGAAAAIPNLAMAPYRGAY